MGYVFAQWYDHGGKRRTKAWPRTTVGRAEAKAWAEGFAERRASPRRITPLTVRQLWERYIGAQTHLRPRTLQLYAEHWPRWELFLGRDFIAEDASKETVDQFRAALAKIGLSVGHVRRIVQTVKTVYAWADTRELLARNRLMGYRFQVAKEDRPKRPAEYRRGEVERIVAQLSPQKSEEWRPWAALTIAALQGARERAILHLTWDDVDLERWRVTRRARFDKTGREWVQPLTLGAYSALPTARWWRDRDRETRPWVFYSPWAHKRCGREEPGVYGAQALWLALRKAETHAGVPHVPFRAVHGFRRGVAGDVARASGDAWLGVQFIGDRDPDRIADYVLERGDELERAVRLLDRSWIDGPKPSTERQPAGRPARIKLDPLQLNDFQAGAGGLEPPTSRLTAGRSAN
jgi:integrase